MGSKGGSTGTQTSTTQNANTSSPPPQVMADYQALVNRATNQANTPYQQYPGELVAPLSNQTVQGLGGINQYSNAAQPFYQAAAAGTTAAATPISATPFSAGQVNQYQNPYTQDVVNSTQGQFNNQNQQQAQFLNSNNISSGAFGGDRAGVSQAILANQQQTAQAPVIAGLYNQSYNQALSEFNTQQGVGLQQQAFNAQNLGQMSNQLANIGTASQQAGLQGATAQTQAGEIPQQEQQAIDTALYNQYQQQQSYPYQTTGWLGNIIEGTGSLSGGTSGGQSTTSTPIGNSASSGLGALTSGLGILGSFLASGGRVGDPGARENVKAVGKTFDGHIIYRFNYKGDPRQQIGLIHEPNRHSQEDKRGHFSLGGSALFGDRPSFASGGSNSDQIYQEALGVNQPTPLINGQLSPIAGQQALLFDNASVMAGSPESAIDESVPLAIGSPPPLPSNGMTAPNIDWQRPGNNFQTAGAEASLQGLINRPGIETPATEGPTPAAQVPSGGFGSAIAAMGGGSSPLSNPAAARGATGSAAPTGTANPNAAPAAAAPAPSPGGGAAVPAQVGTDPNGPKTFTSGPFAGSVEPTMTAADIARAQAAGAPAYRIGGRIGRDAGGPINTTPSPFGDTSNLFQLGPTLSPQVPTANPPKYSPVVQAMAAPTPAPAAQAPPKPTPRLDSPEDGRPWGGPGAGASGGAGTGSSMARGGPARIYRAAGGQLGQSGLGAALAQPPQSAMVNSGGGEFGNLFEGGTPRQTFAIGGASNTAIGSDPFGAVTSWVPIVQNTVSGHGPPQPQGGGASPGGGGGAAQQGAGQTNQLTEGLGKAAKALKAKFAGQGAAGSTPSSAISPDTTDIPSVPGLGDGGADPGEDWSGAASGGASAVDSLSPDAFDSGGADLMGSGDLSGVDFGGLFAKGGFINGRKRGHFDAGGDVEDDPVVADNAPTAPADAPAAISAPPSATPLPAGAKATPLSPAGGPMITAGGQRYATDASGNIAKGGGASASTTAFDDQVSKEMGGSGSAADAPAAQAITAAAGPAQGNVGRGGGDSRTLFYNTFRSLGLSPQASLGAMYGLGGESGAGLNPLSYNKDDPGGSVGIGQWNGPRRQALQNFAAQQGGSPTDPAIQAAYMKAELTGKIPGLNYSGVLNQLKNTNSVADATQIWTGRYESPSINNWQARLARGPAMGSVDAQGNFVPGKGNYGSSSGAATAFAGGSGGQPAGVEVADAGTGIPDYISKLLDPKGNPYFSARDYQDPNSPKRSFFNALTMAGLAMMGGESRSAAVNIGRGGMAGMEYYQKQTSLDRDWMEKQAQIDHLSHEDRRADVGTAIEAQKMMLEQQKIKMAADWAKQSQTLDKEEMGGGEGGGPAPTPAPAAPPPKPTVQPGGAIAAPGQTTAPAPIVSSGGGMGYPAMALAPPAAPGTPANANLGGTTSGYGGLPRATSSALPPAGAAPLAYAGQGAAAPAPAPAAREAAAAPASPGQQGQQQQGTPQNPIQPQNADDAAAYNAEIRRQQSILQRHAAIEDGRAMFDTSGRAGQAAKDYRLQARQLATQETMMVPGRGVMVNPAVVQAKSAIAGGEAQARVAAERGKPIEAYVQGEDGAWQKEQIPDPTQIQNGMYNGRPVRTDLPPELAAQTKGGEEAATLGAQTTPENITGQAAVKGAAKAAEVGATPTKVVDEDGNAFSVTGTKAQEIAQANSAGQPAMINGKRIFDPDAPQVKAMEQNAQKYNEEDRTMNTNYAKNREMLTSLAPIYKAWRAGRGGEETANLTGWANRFGLGGVLPAGWQTAPGGFDSAIKVATMQAFGVLQDTPGLQRAPRTGLQETLLTSARPDADPTAAWNIITHGLATLDYNRDMHNYVNKNISGINVNKAVDEFSNAHDFQPYLEKARKEVPPNFKGITPDSYKTVTGKTLKKETATGRRVDPDTGASWDAGGNPL